MKGVRGKAFFQKSFPRKKIISMKNKKKEPRIRSKALGNRTVIGIICIVAAVAICFGVAPLVNKVSEGTARIVRVTHTIPQGGMITEDAVELVDVGSFNLPGEVLRKKEDVIGKYAAVDLYAGEYLLPGKITTAVATATDLLGNLVGDKKAISVTIGSFAQGVSGKLETGDVISAIVYSQKEGVAFTPPELQYVMVITSTTNKGIDKADVTDSAQPVTVTLLVNQAQAELLAQYEKTASMHFALEYRGDAETVQRYLAEQAAYFQRGDGE